MKSMMASIKLKWVEKLLSSVFCWKMEAIEPGRWYHVSGSAACMMGVSEGPCKYPLCIVLRRDA